MSLALLALWVVSVECGPADMRQPVAEIGRYSTRIEATNKAYAEFEQLHMADRKHCELNVKEQ